MLLPVPMDSLRPDLSLQSRALRVIAKSKELSPPRRPRLGVIYWPDLKRLTRLARPCKVSGSTRVGYGAASGRLLRLVRQCGVRTGH